MDIYREDFLYHYKNPSNWGLIDAPTQQIVEKNPLCGDVISMQIVVEDNKLADVKFEGSACSVSTAATSLLTDFVKGKSLEEIKKLEKDDVLNLLNVDLTTSRINCAVLPLDALKKLINNYEQQKSD